MGQDWCIEVIIDITKREPSYYKLLQWVEKNGLKATFFLGSGGSHRRVWIAPTKVVPLRETTDVKDNEERRENGVYVGLLHRQGTKEGN